MPIAENLSYFSHYLINKDTTLNCLDSDAPLISTLYRFSLIGDGVQGKFRIARFIQLDIKYKKFIKLNG